jgi:uncharacterized protein
VLELLRDPMARYPLGFARSLNALDFRLGRPKEVAIVGSFGSPDTAALLKVVFGPFHPNKVVAGAEPGSATIATPLLDNRDQRDGKATAYVCENYVCQAPTTNPAELRALLSAP